MTEDKNTVSMRHNLILEDRRVLSVSGVRDVDSFDEQTVVIFTDMGELTVTGTQLHINKLSLEVGELLMEGNIASLIYSDNQPKSVGGFFSKVFR
ncbi:MAG: sporulation protein YabP [Oscillospiraceae bacterium]|jgi:sporulation protein YabP|nr:sporulation protein YabP [Oscillospiraceae bacterium]